MIYKFLPLLSFSILMGDNFLNSREKQIYSQQGEDGIIEAIFQITGTDNQFYVDIGAYDGILCSNTYLLRENGWKGIGFDNRFSVPELDVYKTFITAENVSEVFAKHSIPKSFDFLSIDIDSIDFYVLKTLFNSGYKPKCICAEYNAGFSFDEDVVVKYEIPFDSLGSNYFGASYNAFKKLGEKYNYSILCSDKRGVNLFMLRNDFISKFEDIELGDEFDKYHKGLYGNGPNGGHYIDPLKRTFTSAEELLK